MVLIYLATKELHYRIFHVYVNISNLQQNN